MKLKFIAVLALITMLFTACETDDTISEIIENEDNISIYILGDYEFTTVYSDKSLKELALDTTAIKQDDILNIADSKNDYKIIIIANNMIADYLQNKEIFEQTYCLLDEGYEIFFITDNLDYEIAEKLTNDISMHIIGEEMDYNPDAKNSNGIMYAMSIKINLEGEYVVGTMEFLGSKLSQEKQDLSILKRALRY